MELDLVKTVFGSTKMRQAFCRNCKPPFGCSYENMVNNRVMTCERGEKFKAIRDFLDNAEQSIIAFLGANNGKNNESND